MTVDSKNEDKDIDSAIASGELVWVKNTAVNHHRCDYLISAKKMTVWSRRPQGVIKRLFGVFAEVENAYLYKDPEFEIYWDQVIGITKDKWGLAPRFTIKLKDGSELVFLTNGYGNAQHDFACGLQKATGITITE